MCRTGSKEQRTGRGVRECNVRLAAIVNEGVGRRIRDAIIPVGWVEPVASLASSGGGGGRSRRTVACEAQNDEQAN